MRRHREKEETDGKAGIGRIHDEILALAVKENTCHRPSERDDECIDDEKERTCCKKPKVFCIRC